MRRRLSPFIALGLGAALLVAPAASLPAAIAAPAAAIVDSPVGEVYDGLVASDGTTYAVGDFTQAGAATGGIARLDATTADVDRNFPTVNGYVSTMVADADGNIYIGGDFVSVGGQPRSDLARINADGSVDAWAPTIGDSNAAVKALAISGSTLYVGGFFTSVNGTSRSRLAAVDRDTGGLLPWNPGASGIGNLVNVFATSGSLLYVGGSFDTIAGQPRRGLAAFNLSDGNLDNSWVPLLNPTGYVTVEALVTDGSLVYIGGDFSEVNSATRLRVASVDAATGAETSWDPRANGSVSAIAIDGTTAYLGGNFFQINGSQPRLRLAAVRTDDTGTATGWDPNVNLNGNIGALLLTGSDVYVGGPSMVKISRSGSGTVDAQWQPRSPVGGGSDFRAFILQGSSVITGGNFTHINVVERNGAAAFDSSMRVTSWNPDILGTGFRIELVNGLAYVVGGFSDVNGRTMPRSNAAAFRTDDTGTATSWAPVFDDWVYDMGIEGSVGYFVGDFRDINGATRRYAGAVRLDDAGSLLAWDPNMGGSSYAIAVNNGTAYIGGSFSTVNAGSVNRNNAAAFATSGSGTATGWDPDFNSDVNEITLHNGVAYVGGGFDEVNTWGATGVVRWGAASVSLDDSGIATSWNPDIRGGDVSDIQVSGDAAYVSGNFRRVNDTVPRDGLAAVGVDDTGTVSGAWVPVAFQGFRYSNSYEGALRLAGSKILVMGDFYMATLDGVDYPGALAALPIPTIDPVPPAPTPPISSSPPRDVQAEAGDRMARVTWEAPAQSGSFPVTSYQVTSVPGGRVCLVTAPTVTCDVTGLTNGTAYTFTVRALTGAGWSAASGASNAVVPQESATPSLVITGSRDGRLIVVTGSSTGMGMGAVLKPWVRVAGQSAFREGAASILVDADGTFQWQRRSGKRTSVYVATPDGSWRSNRVIIPVR